MNEKMRDAIRLQKVRDAYWEASEDSDFSRIHDAVVEAMGISPSMVQIRDLYNMLPSDIIGQGIMWDFDDTEVGDSVYTFIQDNKAKVKGFIHG